MADAIMTFYRSSAVGIPPHVVIYVGIEGATIDNITMAIEYDMDTGGMCVQGIPGNKGSNAFNPVKTPLGLVKQVNAYFKQIYNNSPDTPVLHVKSFRFYANRTSYPHNVKDYEIQDLTRIQDIFDLLVSNGQTAGHAPAGISVPTSCTVLNSNVYFYNVCGNPVNSPSGVDVSHGEQAFRNSMIANVFKLIP